MSKSLFAVFGATGNQGNSTAQFVLNDPELSQRYAVRAISRDTSNPKMQDLKSKGAELVQADLDDPSSLPAALKGVEFVFFMTTTQYQGNTREIETRQAKSFCEAALAQSVKYIIFSSMSHPYKITKGVLKNVEHFDDKAEIEQYIRTLPVKSAFFAPGSFMQNFHSRMKPRPSYTGDGTYFVANIGNSDTKYPLIDITDTGKWIGAILASPEEYEGKFLAAAEGLYTMDEACAIIEKVTGKTVKYQQLPDEMFKGFLPEGMREPLYEMFVLQRDYGYYGETMEEQVAWAREQARSKLIGLEEFLRREKYTVE
ncbi:NAD(P)-binding protein [Cucurbitaria berberidis CBS 394.84]|uniref:NAD(P)-binding protein n=1 Tax=Cucurbitaria berberidis CBS 394.84 TaxID=1168544 RepID=A0A9P4L9F4_9PLEO|nr:NAD(P)-binding protein [Cucurbitaria berberidis CBS 394.84]KAF1846322.1 NAD(P)-binding protein [Cucurbitaria berberidis CBS 394.84]